MSEKNIKLLHTVYSVLLSISLAVCAALFIVSCIGIYNSSGSDPYTQESISAAFAKIAVPVYISLVLVIGGAILNLALPQEKKKARSKATKAILLRRISSNLDLDNCSVETGAGILIRRAVRKILTAVVAVDYIVHAVIALVYILNPESFPAVDPNAEIIKATLTVLINLAVPFILTLIVMHINLKLVAKELTLVQRALSERRAAEQNTDSEDPPFEEAERFFKKAKYFFTRNEKKLVFASRLAVFAVGLLFIGLGIWNGGAADVIKKAIKICTECIGLG